MSKALLLIVVLANHGYWFGGQNSTITAHWAVKTALPATVMEWQLTCNQVRLAQGAMDIKAGDAPATLTLAMPEVRVATPMTWGYRLKGKEGTVIQAEELPVILYPKKLFLDFSQRLKARHLVVIDSRPELSDFLTAAGITNTRLDDIARLETVQADVCLIAPGAVQGSAMLQGRLVDQAAHGASIGILQQEGGELIGYRLTPRVMGRLNFRDNHPLLAGLDAAACTALWSRGGEVRAIALPADEPALDVVRFARETPGTNPAPIDALLVTKTIGAGRIVLCQSGWSSLDKDPLTQIFCNNLLSYLLTRPEPTLKPSEQEVQPERASKAAINLLPTSLGIKP